MGKMKPVDGRFPFQKQILVCVGPRCTDRKLGDDGGEPIREMLKDLNKSLGRKPHVRVCGVTCMDMCDDAPNMVSWPDGRVYTELDRKSAERAYLEATSDVPVRKK